jgi:hypothetical protein
LTIVGAKKEKKGLVRIDVIIDGLNRVKSEVLFSISLLLD